MPLNPFFQQGIASEQSLWEEIIIESIQAYGQEVYYIPRKLITRDEILNESYNRFSDAYSIEMYLESYDGYEGDGTFLQKFGVEIRDSATFVVSKLRWERLVGVHNNEIQSIRPMEGDLIYIPLTSDLFQINYVEPEKPFYQLSNINVFKIKCELFEYRDEQLDTGITDIDKIEYDFASRTKLYLDSNPTPYLLNEVVFVEEGDAVISAKIAEIYSDENAISVYGIRSDTDNVKPRMEAGSILVGHSTGHTTIVIEKKESFENDKNAQNDMLEDFGNDFIDFSEDNPFGKP